MVGIQPNGDPRFPFWNTEFTEGDTENTEQASVRSD